MRNASSVVLVAIASLTFTACGKINHMQETTDKMADTTNHMSETTDHMAKTTDGMAETTNKMAKTTDHMSETTDGMATTTNHMSETTDKMATTTDKMATTTDGMAKTTTHMSETTDKMATTTDKMATTTDKMAVTTDHMNETTCTMYASLRQGNTKVSRDTDLEAIKSSKNQTEKLELAAKYMQGFEYQVWSPVCLAIASREVVIEQATTELLTALQPFIGDRGNVSASNQSKNYQTLYALSATLHRTNPLQASLLKGTTETAMTFEDILVQGIALEQQRNRGEVATAFYPSWATIVGKYEKDAEFILRLRANFLLAYAYAIADADDFGNSPKFWEKLFDVKVKTSKLGGKLFGSKWKPNLAKRTPTEIRERMTAPLLMAAATRASLKKLGIAPMTDVTFTKLWAFADFSGFDLAKMDKAGGDSKARAAAIREFIAARDAAISI